MKKGGFFIPPRSGSFAAAVIFSVVFAIFVGIPLIALLAFAAGVMIFGSSVTGFIDFPADLIILIADALIFCIMYIIGTAGAGRRLAPLAAAWLVNAGCQTAALAVMSANDFLPVSGVLDVITGSWKYNALFIAQIAACILIGTVLLLTHLGKVRRKPILLIVITVSFAVHLIHLLVLADKLALASVVVPALIPTAAVLAVLAALLLFAPMFFLCAALKRSDN